MKHFYSNIKGWFNFQDIYNEQVDKAMSGDHFVEVGAWLGKSSAYMAVEIINSGKNIQFDIVDTFEGADTPGQNAYTKDHDVYAEFKSNLKPVLDSVNVHRMESVKAAELYEDQSLDFVFIDAAHDYDNVKADIKAWLPKVKPGGTIAGHDYSRSHPGLKRAVNEAFDTFEVKKSSWIVKL